MFPKYSEIQIPLLAEIDRRSGATKPGDIDHLGRTVYDALADHFNLTQEARNTIIMENGKGRSKWHNMVRWTRNDLKKLGLLFAPQHGVWAITNKGKILLRESQQEEIGQGIIPHEYQISPDTFKVLRDAAEKIGENGELLVFNHEKQFLLRCGRPDLAQKVYWVAKNNIAAGYDILSFTENGEEKYIEVKTSKSNRLQFEITQNELGKAKELGAKYWVYKVLNIDSGNPSMVFFHNFADLVEKGHFLLAPISWQVTPSED